MWKAIHHIVIFLCDPKMSTTFPTRSKEHLTDLTDSMQPLWYIRQAARLQCLKAGIVSLWEIRPRLISHLKIKYEKFTCIFLQLSIVLWCYRRLDCYTSQKIQCDLTHGEGVMNTEVVARFLLQTYLWYIWYELSSTQVCVKVSPVRSITTTLCWIESICIYIR